MSRADPPLDPPRGNAPRPAAADLHRKRLCHLQPLPAAGASDGRRRPRSHSRPIFARLVPDATERAWLWHWLAHKTRRPWVPMIAVIMVAEKFGSGRGTLFEILDLLFGADYVVPCAFGELTGTSAGARFNARLADALFTVVNEAVDEDGRATSQRRHDLRRAEDRDRAVADSAAALRGEGPTRLRPAVGDERDHRDPASRRDQAAGGRSPLQRHHLRRADDGQAEQAAIRNWMAEPENIGALQRALLATPAAPLEAFDPFGEPPPFAGRREMIGMARSGIEDAYETAIDALEGYPLFTLTQAERLVGWFGRLAGGEDRVRHAIAKHAYRRRERGEPDNRLKYRGRQEIVYARTEPERRRWRPADREMVVAALNRTEEQIIRIMRSENDALSNFTREREDND